MAKSLLLSVLIYCHGDSQLLLSTSMETGHKERVAEGVTVPTGTAWHSWGPGGHESPCGDTWKSLTGFFSQEGAMKFERSKLYSSTQNL